MAEKELAFAKAYGHLRYFCPIDDLIDFDWNGFANYGAVYMENKLDTKESLDDLFSPFKSSIRFDRDSMNLVNYFSKITASYSEELVYWTHLGNGDYSIGPDYASKRTRKKGLILPNSSNDYGSIFYRLPVEDLAGKEIRFEVDLMMLPYTIAPRIYASIQGITTDHSNLELTSIDQNLVNSEFWSHQELEILLPQNLARGSLEVTVVGFNGGIKVRNPELSVKTDGKWYARQLPLLFDETNVSRDWNPSGPNFNHKKISDTLNTIQIQRSKGTLRDTVEIVKTSTPPNYHICKVSDNLFLGHLLVIDEKSKLNLNDLEFQRLKKSLVLANSNPNQISRPQAVADFVILYNEIEHFYPYLEEYKIDIDESLLKVISKLPSAYALNDHLNEIEGFLAPLRDSHISVNHQQAVKYYPPVQIEYVANQYRITRTVDSLESLLGCSIRKINGERIEQLWEKNMATIGGANESRRKINVGEKLLRGAKGTMVNIEIEKDQEIKNIKLVRSNSHYLRNFDIVPLQWYGEVFYFNMMKGTYEEFMGQMNNIMGAKGIILDMRGYPRWGNHEVIAHFINEEVNSIFDQTPIILQPHQRNTKYLEPNFSSLKPKAPNLDTPIIVLTDARAISYAEMILSYIKYYSIGQIIGQPTAGSSGNVNMLYLPTGTYIPYSGKAVFNQDSSKFQGIGILPDITVSYFESDAITDRQLQYALELFNR